MKIVAESSGFALWFTDEDDLDKTIAALQSLKKFRESKPTRSWPAFHYEAVARRGGVKYGRQFLRFLRSRLHPVDPNLFTD